MDARKFFFVCAGLLCLAVAYCLGASTTRAQGGGAQFAGITGDWSSGSGYVVAITADGNLYARYGFPECDGSWGGDFHCGWVYAGSVLGGPVPVEGQTFGKTKAKYR